MAGLVSELVRSAVALVQALATPFRLPEPQRRAHLVTVGVYKQDRDRQSLQGRRYPNFVAAPR